MAIIRHEKITDIAAREALLDDAFGIGRTAKTAERLREGRLPADGLSYVATERGRVIGTARLWHAAPELGQPGFGQCGYPARPSAALAVRAIFQPRGAQCAPVQIASC